MIKLIGNSLKNNLDYAITVALLLTTITTGLVASSTHINADDVTDVTDTATISVPSSCSMTATVDTEHNANIPNGIYSGSSDYYPNGIGKTTIATFCNDNSGYAVYAIGFTGDKYDGEDHTKLIGATNGQKIVTGTATSGNTSNWAMKLTKVTDSTESYNPENLSITNGYDDYNVIPDTYTKVASYTSTTDLTLGSVITTTYAAYISPTEVADTYTGKVKYTLVHPNTEIPLQPQTTSAGKICYYPNGSAVVGTMGCQTVSTSATSATLFASNFSRTGYGFAGWSNKFDYATNTDEDLKFYGPNEDISFEAGTYTGNNPGLSLYAVWVKSEGSLQDSSKVSQLCGTGTGSLTAATYNNENDDDESTWSITAGLSSVSALTDTRDNNTYAIAKLSDGNCWMIENLRLDNTAELTTTNTNNPLNDGTTVTLKHNYADTDTYNTLSPTSSVAYNADTAPDGWCITDSAACDNQSRLRTDNTANRATYTQNDTMSTSANLYSYGNYYNWYSATAGRGTYSTGSGFTTAGDLCPAGWHVPTGTGSGEYGLLSNSLGGRQINGSAFQMTNNSNPTGIIMSARLRHYPNNTVYSGTVYNDSIESRGSGFYYWTSTTLSSTPSWVYTLFYKSSSIVEPGTMSSSTGRGDTLRCMAPVSP